MIFIMFSYTSDENFDHNVKLNMIDFFNDPKACKVSDKFWTLEVREITLNINHTVECSKLGYGLST